MMEKRKKGILREIWLPVLLACILIGELLKALICYKPHADSGFLPLVLSVLVGCIAVATVIAAYRRENWLRFGLWTALLVLCLLCLFAASRIPFCPECDGECKSLLLRWIHPDVMDP